ncbi:hypothetical protein CEK62_08560 [Alcanivorax sp. N3-2A]|nr:hypothetical protein CEK62_08560 [Alcanivorax sp. N3-2A]|tara:strand:+ start:6512 stop:7225 length:714 start_codon:yes stop_codon:yes gene_type:complete
MKRAVLLLAPLLLTLCSTLAMAEPLAPFSAKYRIYVNKIPTPITATLTLEPAGDDRYHMLFLARSWLLDNKEESWFHWNNCQPRTQRYVHEFNGFGKHRYHHTDFNWAKRTVISRSEDGTDRFAFPDDALDELSMLLRARCVFATGDKEYDATSVYGDDIRHHHFVVIDRETIDTPMGELDTLVVEKKRDKDNDSNRRTLFWVAPKVGYMVVKARHIESALLHGELNMTEYSGPEPD